MVDWLKDAKDIAKEEAENFVENMYEIADSKDLEREWFLEEVVKNMHEIKSKKI